MSRLISAHTLIALFASIVMATATVQAQTTWYVDDDAPNDPGPGDPTVSDPNENGTPEHPFDAIGEGIDAAHPNDTVLVLDGTYTGPGNKDLSFGGKSITVGSENGPDDCTIDCEGSGKGFDFHTGETAVAVVDGFTITNGFSNGGAVRCFASSPTIANCVIAGNTAFEYGGGIFCDWDGHPTISHCTITGNSAGFGGGGIGCYLYSFGPTITNCAIAANSAVDGGGLYIISAEEMTITNCTIAGNTAGHAGGLFAYDSSLRITNCTITGNYAGGMCYIHAELVISNCAITGNHAVGIDGLAEDPFSQATIANCTIASNAGPGVSCYMILGASMTLGNCVVWHNAGAAITAQEAQPSVTYSDIEGGWPGVGNIDADPLFVGFADYHLSPGSPCIDAAANTAVAPDTADLDGDGDATERTPLDLNSIRRFVDRPSTVDTGVPDPPDYPQVVDMGAYEFGLAGDTDGDCDVDQSDLAQLLANYGTTSGMGYEDGNVDGDGDVDLADLAILLGVYGTTCE